VPVRLERREGCPECAGTGARDGSKPRLCPDCNGRGVKGRNLGGFARTEACARCSGRGTVIDDPCPRCQGAGSLAVERKVQVKIPPGAKDGTRIRLKGRGGRAPRGGEPGDLHVITRVTPSALYERRGDDLVLEVPVTFAEAALGAKVEVPTPSGPIVLSVPAGSEQGKLLRVRERGAPRLNGAGTGDLLARLRVVVPASLSTPQREALERFAKLDAANPREALF
jgi:molecular chaperone DnaJ